jgi:hypothetical protein
LGEPVHGWVLISIRVGAEVVECHASYIVDSLTDLVYAALEITERRPIRPVIVFEEPGAIRISLVSTEQLVRVSITRHRDLASARNDRNGTQLLSTSVESIRLARAIWSAMRRLEGALSRDLIEAAWHNPFPAKEVAQLGERLRDEG